MILPSRRSDALRGLGFLGALQAMNWPPPRVEYRPRVKRKWAPAGKKARRKMAQASRRRNRGRR